MSWCTPEKGWAFLTLGPAGCLQGRGGGRAWLGWGKGGCPLQVRALHRFHCSSPSCMPNILVATGRSKGHLGCCSKGVTLSCLASSPSQVRF